jgi:hypothetical protein
MLDPILEHTTSLRKLVLSDCQSLVTKTIELMATYLSNLDSLKVTFPLE